MKYAILIAAIIFIASAVVSLQRHIHMYQQNSYFLKRYFNWGKSHIGFKLWFNVILALVCLVLFFLKAYIVALVIAAIQFVCKLLAFKVYNKTAIKKLVYTNRVKRLITCACIILALSLLLLASSFNNATLSILSFSLVLLLSCVPACLLVVSAFIMGFIEKAISNSYVKEAKDILKSMPNLKVIGVTGSYGKTSAKFILKRILSEKYNVTATPESFNTPMGIVRTVREHLTPQTEIFIAEMGAKNIGDIKELCELAKPTTGIITAVGPQHLESFKTVENVAKTKFELADFTHNVYVNFESEAAKQKASEYVTHPYGLQKGCETYAKNILVSYKGTEFDLVHFDTEIHLTTKLLGNHNVLNIVGACAIALELGVSPESIKYAVSTLTPTEHRLEKKAFLNGSILLDDSYNSNPEGSKMAVEVLGQFEDKTKIIVTPGMVELGEKEYEFNYKLGEYAAKVCDYLIFVGDTRSIPLKKAALDNGFNEENIFICKRFKDSLEILQRLCNNDTVVLFENDLPDNYAG